MSNKKTILYYLAAATWMMLSAFAAEASQVSDFDIVGIEKPRILNKAK